ELLGGTKMLKALSAPLPEIGFFPTGGISADLVQDYLKLGCVSCVGGSWFIPVELLEANRFNDIKTLTQSALQLSHV
ncbi:MAG: keto-deoxy-phosphogluconate aldolase, partial [Pseudomonadota bacterium]|nr:keto-deoxy-phosphogluconate aldolase [Pseudomonadota bacterium]